MKRQSLGDVLMEWTVRIFGTRLIDAGKPADYHHLRLSHATYMLLYELSSLPQESDVHKILMRYSLRFPPMGGYALSYPDDFPEHLQLTEERIRRAELNESLRKR